VVTNLCDTYRTSRGDWREVHRAERQEMLTAEEYFDWGRVIEDRERDDIIAQSPGGTEGLVGFVSGVFILYSSTASCTGWCSCA